MSATEYSSTLPPVQLGRSEAIEFRNGDQPRTIFVKCFHYRLKPDDIHIAKGPLIRKWFGDVTSRRIHGRLRSLYLIPKLIEEPIGVGSSLREGRTGCPIFDGMRIHKIHIFNPVPEMIS